MTTAYRNMKPIFRIRQQPQEISSYHYGLLDLFQHRYAIMSPYTSQLRLMELCEDVGDKYKQIVAPDEDDETTLCNPFQNMMKKTPKKVEPKKKPCPFIDVSNSLLFKS